MSNEASVFEVSSYGPHRFSHILRESKGIVVLYSKGPPLAFYEDYDLNIIFKTTYKGRDTSTNRESPGDPCALGPLVPDLCCTPSSAIVNRHVSVI